MAESKVSPAPATADVGSPEFVSKTAASRFSQWLNLVGTKALWDFQDKSQLVVEIEHRAAQLGQLVLKKQGPHVLVEALFKVGGVVRYTAVIKNFNLCELREPGGVSLVEQLQKPDLAGAVKRWVEIEKCSSEGLV